MSLTCAAIARYPVKSMRGEPLAEATVEPWGLVGDRRWLVVGPDGRQRTAREHPALLLVTARLADDGGLRLSHTDRPDLVVPAPSGPLITVGVWSHEVEATTASDEAAGWLSDLLGAPSRLAYLDDPTRRRPNPAFARPEDRVSFADGYPLLVTTEASLAELNRLIAYGPRAEEGPLPMARFRPNLVVAGGAAWAEDGWRRLRVGEATFRAVKGCDRCVMTLRDPDTAARGKEPVLTLSRHRRWDGATWFGMNLIPDTPGAVIRPGDDVEILDAVPAPDGPPR